MSGFNPSQVSFSAGEWSPAMGGRVDLEARRFALAYCGNAKPRPQGPALMRAGSWLVTAWPEADLPRLFDLRLSGSAEDLVVAVGAEKIRIYTAAGDLLSYLPNLVLNGGFDSYQKHWSTGGGAGISYFWENGSLKISIGGWTSQAAIATVAGHTYEVQFRARGLPVFPTPVRHFVVNVGGVDIFTTPELPGQWTKYTTTFVGTGAPVVLKFTAAGTPGLDPIYLDDVVLFDQDGTPQTEFVSPWTAAQLPAVQYAADVSKGRVVFAHREVEFQVLQSPADGVFELFTVDTTFGAATATPNWGPGNWPGIVESFQGRLWLASTPQEPHVFWASRSGSPFDFDLGTGTAADGMSYVVTTKGRVEWMQGQRVLLAGSGSGEHVVKSETGLIKPADIDIQDASALGSAPVQARHIGDQVVFVSSDGRKVRGLDYSWEKQAWFSRAITWAAEHIIDAPVTELHFSRSPDPVIIAVLASGELRACTYDRGENVVAWWRISTSGTVQSAAVIRTSSGDELWLSVVRGASKLLERLPLHEVGVGYVDSAVTGMVPVTGVIPGLTHLEGQMVRVVVDGTLLDDQEVAGGVVTVAAELATKAYVVGLAYRAKVKELPLEGGLQTGSSQSAKRRRTKVRLRLNNSALPLVNGKRAPERRPADPMDTGTDLFTGDVDCNQLGWSEDGALTIEQDLPFRTEVVAIFGNAQVNEV